MNQRPYLVRLYRREGNRGQVAQAARIHVQEPERTKVARSTRIPGLGSIDTHVGTGQYERTTLRLSAGDAEFRPGHRTSNFYRLIPRTAAGVKEVLRRLRDQEAAELDAIDADIAAALERVRVLAEQRREVLARAWQRGNVVRLSEVEAVIGVEHAHNGTLTEGANNDPVQ